MAIVGTSRRQFRRHPLAELPHRRQRFRSVVFLLPHDDEGALGLVLTRPTSSATREDDFDELPPKLEEHLGELYWGGPVPGPLLALHEYEEFSQGEVVPGVHFCADKPM